MSSVNQLDETYGPCIGCGKRIKPDTLGVIDKRGPWHDECRTKALALNAPVLKREDVDDYFFA